MWKVLKVLSIPSGVLLCGCYYYYYEEAAKIKASIWLVIEKESSLFEEEVAMLLEDVEMGLISLCLKFNPSIIERMKLTLRRTVLHSIRPRRFPLRVICFVSVFSRRLALVPVVVYCTM